MRPFVVKSKSKTVHARDPKRTISYQKNSWIVTLLGVHVLKNA